MCRIGVVLLLLTTALQQATAAPGELELAVVDSKSGEPIAGQIRLVNQRGRSVRARGLVVDGDWQSFDGTAVLRLSPGRYEFEIRRGLEYRRRFGNFLIRTAAADNRRVDLVPILDMRSEGWWSGDLDIDVRTFSNVPMQTLASDLDVLTLALFDAATKRSLSDRGYDELQRRVDDIGERLGSASWVGGQAIAERYDGAEALLYGIDVADWIADSELAKSASALRRLPAIAAWQQERSAGTGSKPPPHLHLTRVTCWDLPAWVATGAVDSVGLLHSGVRSTSVGARTSMALTGDAQRERPRDMTLFPGVHGAAQWAQHVYFQLLESGHAITPTGGSGAGRGASAFGSNRFYVQCGPQFNRRAWWEALGAGRVVVTNGPLLRLDANGQPPGHRFLSAADARTPFELQITASLATQHKIHYLELIQNGRPVAQVRLQDWAANNGRLPVIKFEASGWALVRAVAESSEGYVAALSGPYFVDVGKQPRVSRAAANFFLDWVNTRGRLLLAAEEERPGPGRKARLVPHREAQDYWRSRVAAATTD